MPSAADVPRVGMDTVLLMPNLSDDARAQLANLPMACAPQKESSGKFNFSLHSEAGTLEVQLANRCFRAKKIGDWADLVKTVSWTGRDPYDAWIEFKSKSGWP